MDGAHICADWLRVLADYSSVNCMYICLRSGSFKLRLFVWHCNRHFACRHGKVFRRIAGDWLWTFECFLPDGILFALYPLRGCARNCPQGIEQLGMDRVCYGFPARCRLGGYVCGLSDWDVVLVRSMKTDRAKLFVITYQLARALYFM